MRPQGWICLLVAVLIAGPGCIVTMQQQKTLPDPKTPARLKGESAPALEPTAVPGVKRAVIEEVPDVYYHEAKERWFRWALDRWFVAFLWNGQWFPVDKGELPSEMVALQPTVKETKKRRLTRAEELKKIDEELKRLEEEAAQSGPDGGAKDEPRELDEQLEKEESE